MAKMEEVDIVSILAAILYTAESKAIRNIADAIRLAKVIRIKVREPK